MSNLPKVATKAPDMAKKPLKKPAEVVVEAPSHAFRETIESIVIAFVLAFLFRTFEAEAFVIPTGSMAPTLMGRHKDVDCPKCGHRYRVTDSDDVETLREDMLQRQAELGDPKLAPDRRLENQRQIEIDRAQMRNMQIVGGVCPVCRYPMPMVPDLPELGVDDKRIAAQPTFNGDRILVNKYLYTVAEPNRFDVVVFHFPGDAEVNYIKRLVGLPGETLHVYQGDLLVGPPGAQADDDFKIARKPADKFLAVRQLVHDTNYDPTDLYAAGWPLRWSAVAPTGGDGWKTETNVDGKVVQEKFVADRSQGGEAWLRYSHTVPNGQEWQRLAALQQQGAGAKFSDDERSKIRPELVMDFNAYNTRIQRGTLRSGNGFWPDESKLGDHWVGDLMVTADVSVTETKGELLLDLVEAGKHFTCRISLDTGRATLGIQGVPDFSPVGQTPLTKPGEYRVAFANVDDQLLVWASQKTWGNQLLDLDPKLITFDKETTYNAEQVFGGLAISPKTSKVDPGDLSPAGIGAKDAKLAITRLQLWRDIYYIADRAPRPQEGAPISDYSRMTDMMMAKLRYDPSTWEEFTRRRWVDFPLADDQVFVMGDNSPESSDARLWTTESRNGGKPGGAYLEKKLPIGKAVCVYWPHAWYTIPFTQLPAWPNFRDMRLVR